MFRQDRTNPSTAISNWRGRHDTPKAWPSSAVSTWLNGGLFGGAGISLHGGYMQYYWQYVSSTKYDFVTEVYASIESAVTNVSGYCCNNISNNQVAGYAMSGINKDDDPQYRSQRGWKCTVATNVFSETAASMVALEHQNGFGYSNSGTAGYYGGGVTQAGPYTTAIQKFTYASDTSASTISGTLDTARYYIQGMAKRGDRGMAWGGWNGVNAGSVMNTVSFSSDTSSTITAISTATYGGGGFSNGQVAGYVSGGFNMGSAIDKYDYSSFSRSTLSATAGAGYINGWPNTGVAGYFAQSATAANQFKLDFSAETVSTPSGSMGSPWTNSSATVCFSTCEASP